MKRTGLMLLWAAFCTSALLGEVRLAAPFTDGMVLQRDHAIAVWGHASAGERVKVMFADHEASARADEQGRWKTVLPALAASKEGRTLSVVSEKTQERCVVNDVLVGEVWYVCGQSNAELPLVSHHPHFMDRQGHLVANMLHLPYVRYVYAVHQDWSATPKTDPDYPVVWKKFLPENLGVAPSFSAIGVYFAVELYLALDVPIGIVGSYWGGTNIDAWTPAAGYRGKEELKRTAEWKVVSKEEWKPERKWGVITSPRQQPSVLWNEMVEPWCPMTMRGLIWYQGCTNAEEGDIYRVKMHALYDGWFERFENPDLKLYFVQIAPFSISRWKVQQAQAGFAAEEKNAALVPTVDVGNSNDVHPTEKGTVGKRLAALALCHDYGFKLTADAPTLKNAFVKDGRLVLSFEHADGWYIYDSSWAINTGFEIAGRDGVWRPATIVNADGGARMTVKEVTRGAIEGCDIVLEAIGVEEPRKVRYLYQKPWIGTLFAKSGLPLAPFEAKVSGNE